MNNEVWSIAEAEKMVEPEKNEMWHFQKWTPWPKLKLEMLQFLEGVQCAQTIKHAWCIHGIFMQCYCLLYNEMKNMAYVAGLYWCGKLFSLWYLINGLQYVLLYILLSVTWK